MIVYVLKLQTFPLVFVYYSKPLKKTAMLFEAHQMMAEDPVFSFLTA